MRRLAFALMTGVGFYLHKEWKKRQQLTLSESRYRDAEKQLYRHFKFLVDKGYELDESRTAYSYKLEFQKEDHFLIFNLKHPDNLNCYFITQEGEENNLESMMEKSGQETLGPEAFSNYDDYLKVISSKVEQFLAQS